MKQKGFKLEQVLTFRRDVEKKCIRDFAEAQDEFESASRGLTEEENRVNDLKRELQDRQREGITIQDLQLYTDYIQRKNTEIKLARLEVESLGRVMAEKREILIEASKEKKVLETLKEKQAQDLMRELNEKERAFLEEVALRNKTQGT